MSKTKNPRARDYDYEDEEYTPNIKDFNHRKNKRLTNILRSKNIDLLMELEEDEC